MAVWGRVEDITDAAADAMGTIVRHIVTEVLNRLGIEQSALPELPRWPQDPPKSIDLDAFTLRLWYRVALPADCGYAVRLTFGHDGVTEPEGVSPAGLAQYERGEWSFYSATATVSDADGNTVASRVALGLRREELYDSEDTYAAVNDAVFAAIDTWKTSRA